MEILNVIEIINGIISSIDSFPIFILDDKQGVKIAKAGLLFTQKALENGMELSDMELAAESGTWDDGNGYEVIINWSNINL